MLETLALRVAEEQDLPEIIRLLSEDALGTTREIPSIPLALSYQQAFQDIQEDRNQMLLVADYQGCIVGTCHLTTLPSLSFQGSRRLNIENIRVDQRFQGEGIGTWMLKKVIEIGQEKNCRIFQLTTNKQRTAAKVFL